MNKSIQTAILKKINDTESEVFSYQESTQNLKNKNQELHEQRKQLLEQIDNYEDDRSSLVHSSDFSLEKMEKLTAKNLENKKKVEAINETLSVMEQSVPDHYEMKEVRRKYINVVNGAYLDIHNDLEDEAKDLIKKLMAIYAIKSKAGIASWRSSSTTGSSIIAFSDYCEELFRVVSDEASNEAGENVDANHFAIPKIESNPEHKEIYQAIVKGRLNIMGYIKGNEGDL